MSESPPAHLIRLAWVSALAGIVTGLVGSAFRVSLIWADTARGNMVTFAHQWPEFGWLIPMAVAAICVAMAYTLVQRFAPVASGSGVQHIEAVMRGEAAPSPLIVLPVKFIGGLLAMGSGLALGREGPTVQMGATIGSSFAALARLGDGDVRTIQSATASAGLAVAFNAPTGGIAFAFEELARRFTTEVMVATLAACATAVVVMRAILGDNADFLVAPMPEPSIPAVAMCVVLGIGLGALGAAYNRVIIFWLDRFAAFDRLPGVARAAGVGAVVGLVTWFEPGIVGGGNNLIQGVLDNQFLYSQLLLILVARWLLGPFSYSAGTPGGLFAPLLVIGAVSGALFADLVNRLAAMPLLDSDVCAIVGMAAFFTAVVRAPLTGTLVVLGMTGSVMPLAPAIAANVGAMIVPALLATPPIYDTLRERMLGRGGEGGGGGKGEKEIDGGRRTI